MGAKGTCACRAVTREHQNWHILKQWVPGSLLALRGWSASAVPQMMEAVMLLTLANHFLRHESYRAPVGHNVLFQVTKQTVQAIHLAICELS